MCGNLIVKILTFAAELARGQHKWKVNRGRASISLFCIRGRAKLDLVTCPPLHLVCFVGELWPSFPTTIKYHEDGVFETLNCHFI
jgi:hypothetical protein